MSQENTSGAAFLAPGTKLNGRYVIERVIGQGGFGITYYARHEMLMHVYAIKEFYISGYNTRDTVHNTVSLQGMKEDMYDKYKQRFVEEARTVVSLDHPNIVKVVDIFEENNTAYMVMPFVEGTSLQKLVEKNGGRLPYELTVNYMGQLSAAVGYIHSKHILHRDIKPDNVLITPDNRVILIDFGSAREFVNDKTQRQTSILTHGYAPPEQYSSVSRKGNYTDIYALGGVYYFCLTGEVPAEATTRLLEAGEGHDPLVEPKVLNPGVSDSVNRTIVKAMALKPENRYQTVAEFMGDLLGNGSSAPTATPKQPVEKKPEPEKKQEYVSVFADSGKNNKKKAKQPEPVKVPEKKQEYKSVFDEPKPQPRSQQKSETPKEPKKKGKAGLWVGIGAAAAVLVVVLVLVFGNKHTSDFDELPGVFSVGPNKTVVFSKGNMQFQPSIHQYRFAENQYDIKGLQASSNVNDWTDLFDFDWGAASHWEINDETWRTLTADEWSYLINRDWVWGCVHAEIDGVYGLVIFPDNWEYYVDVDEHDHLLHIKNTSFYEDNGAVFLPAYVNGEEVFYWTSSIRDYNTAYLFNLESMDPYDWDYQSTGACVRLVREYSGFDYDVIEEDWPEYEEDEIEEEEVFMAVEEMPEFPGGTAKLLEYIHNNLKYPMEARENGIQGRVFVGFVVEKDGSISNVKVLSGIGGGCDEEAVRVVQSLPKFNPGKQRGNPVRVQYTLPIVFQLQ